jgi:transcriptional regulator with XRE-family HTH domain
MPWNPQALKRIRERRGWSQAELAERAGSHQVSIARLEVGVREPRIDLLEKLAKALKVPVTDLLRPQARGGSADTKSAEGGAMRRARTRHGTKKGGA